MSILRIFFTLALQLACLGVFPLSATSNLYDKVDDMSLSYDGNRLTDISQGSDADDFYDYTPYGDPSAASGQCTYDQNGNMTSNRLKGISSISYNLLNLPEQVTFTDGSTASYSYDMTGAKRRVVYSTASSTLEQPVASAMQSEAGTGAQAASQSATVSTTVDYHGSLIFQDYSQKYIRLEDDGIWTGPDGYCFYIRDHLGSVRSVNTLNGSCAQTSQYYPFGKMWDDLSWGSGSTQPFRYGGKELDRMHGLDCYDYGARMYDPGIGRFMTIDPKAEDYYDTSPYAYCLNNPIKNIDPDGRSVWSRGAKLLWHVGKAVAKNGLKALNTVDTYTSAFSDIQESVNTLTDANASTADKVMAGVSLASELAPVSVGDAKEIGKTVKGLTKDYSKIGATGKVGEEVLKQLGGDSQKTFKTSQGIRRVDQFSKGVAHESKVGYQSLTKGIKSQIQKDAELMESNAANGATWHFFESLVTGKNGPSKPLMDELRKNNIKVEIHE